MQILILGSDSKSLRLFRGDLIKDMLKFGHEVVVSTPNEDTRGEIRLLGVKHFIVKFAKSGTNSFGDFRLVRDYRTLIKEEKPDMIFCYTIKPNIYGAITSKQAGVKHIFAMVTGLGNMFISTGSFNRAALGMIVKFLY